MVFSQILTSEVHNLRRIKKSDTDFSKNFHKVKYRVKFPGKARHVHEIEKKNSIDISVFGYENKGKYPIYVLKKMLRRQSCWFIIDRRKKQKALCSYQRFEYVHVWSYITLWKKTFLLLLFTCFQYRRNIKTP